MREIILMTKEKITAEKITKKIRLTILIQKRFPNAVLRIYFIAFNLTILVFNYKSAFSLSVGELKFFTSF